MLKCKVRSQNPENTCNSKMEGLYRGRDLQGALHLYSQAFVILFV